MEPLATRDEQQIWLHKLARPYDLDSPFAGERYVCILFANDRLVTADEQALLSHQLIGTGCRYAVCAGYQCSTWDDSIDLAALAIGNFEGDDERFVMTTWHEQESVEDVVFHGLMNSMLTGHEFRHVLVLFLGHQTGLYEELQSAIRSVWHIENNM